MDFLSELYVWHGSKSSEATVQIANQKAQEILTARKTRPSWVKVTTLKEGAETVLFQEKFTNWSSLPVSLQKLEINVSSVPHAMRGLQKKH
jgi:hypothetical protein